MSNNSDDIMTVLKRHRNEMSEHVDSIQILATWMEDGETRYAFIGSGNMFARQAMAAQYAEAEMQLSQENEQDGEGWLVDD